MSDNPELEDLKKLINSLIIPNPSGLTLRHLCNDYKEIEGEMIPFKKFGFTSVTALLKSMPDKVRMEGDLTDINTVTLYPVRNEDNAHIVDLVRGQNKTRKGKRGRARPTFYPTRVPGFHNYKPFQRSTPTRPLSRSYSNLNGDANEPPSETNPYQDSTHAMHQKLYTDIWSAYYQYYDALSKVSPYQLQQLAANSYTSYNRNVYRPPLLPNCVPTPNPTTAPPMRGYFPQPTVNYNKPIDTELINKFQNFTINRQMPNSNDRPSSQISRSSRSASDINNMAVNNGQPKPMASPGPCSQGSVPDNVKNNIRKLMTLEDVSDGMMLFNFQARYKFEFKEVLDHQRYGFDSLADCLKSMPHLIEMIEAGKTYKLMPNKNPIPEPEVPKEEKTLPQSPIRNGMIANLAVKTSPTTVKTMPRLIRTIRPKTSTSSSSDALSASSPSKTCIASTDNTSTTTMTSQPRTATNGQPTLPVLTPISSWSSNSTTVKTTPNIQLGVKPTTTAVIATPSPDSSSSPKLNEIPDQRELLPDIPRDISPIERPTDLESVRSFESNANLNPIAKHNFRRVLMAHENGVKSIDFPQEYQRLCNVNFDSRIWGFRTAMELFSGLPSIFTIEQNDKKETILHDSRFKRFEKPKPLNIDPTTVFRLTNLPDRAKARIVRLVQLCGTTGLAIEDFSRFYTLSYEPLDLSSWRVPNTDYLFEAIKHDLPIKLSTYDNQKKAMITSEDEVREWVVNHTRSHRYVVPITMVDTPANSVLPGEVFEKIRLPDKFEEGNYEYVAIYISSAVNPQEIYIQFKGTDYHTALEKLMWKLDFYETAPPEHWAVPYEFIHVGYPVICKYPGDRNWHRAKISRLHPSNKKMVTVSFVDYGGTTVVDYTSLRLMKREFFLLPSQALRVGLYGIKPTNGPRVSDWTFTARDKILKYSKPYYALACTLIKVKDGIHWVAICDTNGETDIFLHSVLIADNNAILKTEEELEEEDRESRTPTTQLGGDQMNGHSNGFQ